MEAEATVQLDMLEPLSFGLPRGSITLATLKNTDHF